MGQSVGEHLDRFALTCFATLLASHDQPQPDDALSVLLMFHIGGLRLAPLLDYWLNCRDPQSTVHYVEASHWQFWNGREVSNPFAQDLPDFRQSIRQWMLAPAHRAIFADKLMQPELLRLVDDRRDSGHMSFRSLVDVIFDALTE